MIFLKVLSFLAWGLLFIGLTLNLLIAIGQSGLLVR